MSQKFQEIKTTQAAAEFLRLSGGKMPYISLLKLLYLMDRESLLRWSAPVTGDDYFSMKMGPVLSNVFDLISKENGSFWSSYIRKSGYDVILEAEAGIGKLSQSEFELIAEIFEKYGHFKKFDLVNHLHEILPEWEQITSGRSAIEIASILKAGNKSPEEIEVIEKDLTSINYVHSLFAVSA